MNLGSQKVILVLMVVLVGLGVSISIRLAKATYRSPLKTDSVPFVAVGTLETGWADESSCIGCHEQAENFPMTGHANTLTAADSNASWGVLADLEQSQIGRAEQVSVSRDSSKIFLQRRLSDDSAAQVPLDWCFGSGAHARTWVTTLTDSLGQTDLLEFRWTWYHHSGDFELTPGQPDQCGAGHLAQFGLQFDGARAWRCFSCHSTRLPTSRGKLDFEGMHAGVTCQRCHGPRQKHVDADGLTTDPRWAFTDRDNEVSRCAECHRDVGEQEPSAVRPGNPDIARFQPIGLSQSECYLKSDMSCTTCHDVHRPMSAQSSRRISQCTQCHDEQDNQQTHCGAGMLDRCIDCHMPALDTGRGLKFVDHWIRIPDESGNL